MSLAVASTIPASSERSLKEIVNKKIRGTWFPMALNRTAKLMNEVDGSCSRSRKLIPWHYGVERSLNERKKLRRPCQIGLARVQDTSLYSSHTLWPVVWPFVKPQEWTIIPNTLANKENVEHGLNLGWTNVGRFKHGRSLEYLINRSHKSFHQERGIRQLR